MRVCGRRGFGRAGTSRTRRSPRCPSRSAACPIWPGCASAGHLRAWLRHLRVRCTFESAGLRRDAVRHAIGCARATSWVTAVQDRQEHADHRAARVVRQPVQSPLTVRPPGTCRTWLRHLCVRCTLDAAGLWLDAVRHAIGRARATSWVTSVQDDLENADRRAARVVRQPVQSRRTVRLPGTCARWVRHSRVRCTLESAGAVAGCGAARDRMGVLDFVGSAAQVNREHADHRAARVVHQPVQAQLTVRPPGSCRAWLRHLCVRCTLDAAGLWLDAVRHAAGCARATSWVTSVQGDPEDADRRAARVVRQPVQAQQTVRPLGTCTRGCGTLASGARWMRPGCGGDAVRHAIGCACVMSWVRPGRTIENTPITALPKSFTSLPQLAGCVSSLIA
jgi:hypothetical protein